MKGAMLRSLLRYPPRPFGGRRAFVPLWQHDALHGAAEGQGRPGRIFRAQGTVTGRMQRGKT
jgi:hypothetical protein